MSLRWKKKKESELNEEVHSHLQMSAQEHVARGEGKEDANRAARREWREPSIRAGSHRRR